MSFFDGIFSADNRNYFSGEKTGASRKFRELEGTTDGWFLIGEILPQVSTSGNVEMALTLEKPSIRVWRMVQVFLYFVGGRITPRAESEAIAHKDVQALGNAVRDDTNSLPEYSVTIWEEWSIRD